MGNDKIRYLVFLKGRWHWQPTKAMRAHGFKRTNLGRGTIDAAGVRRASSEDKAKAVGLNAEWDAVRHGLPAPVARGSFVSYPHGSVGDGFQRAMALRMAARAAAGKPWTNEQRSRDDWPRAWKWLEEFALDNPETIQPEHFLTIDTRTGAPKGLIPRIEAAVSVTERHRVIKVWRSLWIKMGGMGYTGGKPDPSKAIQNSAPEPRAETWRRREVLRLVQRAWREGYRGLAACMAVAWDTMLSPVDARTLTPAKCVSNGAGGLMFTVGRAKTGKAAAGTLTPWSRALLLTYMAGFGAEPLKTVPIFRTRGRAAGLAPGGKPWQPRPYTKDKLAQDFALIRAMVFGADEARVLSDMRRSGAVEGDAGGATVTDQANKMANTVSANNRLRKTYNPVNVKSVERFDEARAIGAKALEQKPHESMPSPDWGILLKKAGSRKPLK